VAMLHKYNCALEYMSVTGRRVRYDWYYGTGPGSSRQSLVRLLKTIHDSAAADLKEWRDGVRTMIRLVQEAGDAAFH